MHCTNRSLSLIQFSNLINYFIMPYLLVGRIGSAKNDLLSAREWTLTVPHIYRQDGLPNVSYEEKYSVSVLILLNNYGHC